MITRVFSSYAIIDGMILRLQKFFRLVEYLAVHYLLFSQETSLKLVVYFDARDAVIIQFTKRDASELPVFAFLLF